MARDITYTVAVREKDARPETAEIYEVDSDSPEQACYTAKDWYVNDFHAHDLDPETDLIAVATPKGA